MVISINMSWPILVKTVVRQVHTVCAVPGLLDILGYTYQLKPTVNIQSGIYSTKVYLDYTLKKKR